MSRPFRSSPMLLGLLLGSALLPSCAHSVPWGGSDSPSAGQPAMTMSAAYVCQQMAISPIPVVKQSTNLQAMPPTPTGKPAECGAQLRCVAGDCALSYTSPMRPGGGVVQLYCDVRGPKGKKLHLQIAPTQFFGRAGTLPEGSVSQDFEMTDAWVRIGAVKTIKPDQQPKQEAGDLTIPEGTEIGQCGFSP